MCTHPEPSVAPTTSNSACRAPLIRMFEDYSTAVRDGEGVQQALDGKIRSPARSAPAPGRRRRRGPEHVGDQGAGRAGGAGAELVMVRTRPPSPTASAASSATAPAPDRRPAGALATAASAIGDQLKLLVSDIVPARRAAAPPGRAGDAGAVAANARLVGELLEAAAAMRQAGVDARLVGELPACRGRGGLRTARGGGGRWAYGSSSRGLRSRRDRYPR